MLAVEVGRLSLPVTSTWLPLFQRIWLFPTLPPGPRIMLKVSEGWLFFPTRTRVKALLALSGWFNTSDWAPENRTTGRPLMAPGTTVGWRESVPIEALLACGLWSAQLEIRPELSLVMPVSARS